jgi:DNA-binding transcriptional regulator YhcF (GntR family)
MGVELPFSIEIVPGEPVNEQILSAVHKAIFTGILQDGDPFPSVRTLSQALKISPTTAHKVVSQLKNTGLLAPMPGIGMVVRALELPSGEERVAMLAPGIRKLVRDGGDLSLELDDLLGSVKRQWELENGKERKKQ